MLIYINGKRAEIQPDKVSWIPPTIIGYAGNGRPVMTAYWKCNLAFPRLTCVSYDDWRLCMESGEVCTITLPHPTTGKLTTFECYVESVSTNLDTRDDCKAYAEGVDVSLFMIEVE